ncbi:MAG: IS66 family transposase [Oscillospiraceae bacterium]|nr:IS66 family transposase [Oscillospiraceae bacterium]
MEEQLKVLSRNHFGSRHETASEEVIGQMSMLFDEPEVYAHLEEIQQETAKVPEQKPQSKSKRVFMLDKLPENTEVKVEMHELSEEERTCPVCGSVMEPIGEEVVRTLEIIPAQFVVHEDRYVNYACKNCSGEDTEEEIGKTQFVKTPHIPAVYPGSYCSPAAAAYLMTQKYVMGSPLYRMEQDFNRSGLSLSRQTMSGWMICCAETWLIPIYKKLHEMLLNAEIINADETELQVLQEPGRKAQTKSYMWLYRTGSYAEHPVVLYEYQPGRGSKYPLNFLSGFKGYLQTDGYVGYDALKDVKHVGCMAHLKRKFHDAVTALPSGKKSGSAVEGEAYCEKLFQLERTFASLSPEERRLKRQELAKPILDEFLAWGSTRNASSKSKLGEALTYLHNNGNELSEYLNDGRLEISNNIAERSIKPFVIDRKNFLFANTPKGASASAVMFSIIQTAIANNLDPYTYLKHIFTEAPKMAAKGEDWVTAVLPENAPDFCKAGSSQQRGQN